MTGLKQVVALAAVLVMCACERSAEPPGQQRTFASPEAGVQALLDVVKKENIPELLAIFGPQGQELVASSDPATGRRNREVFTVAMGEGWRLADQGNNQKTLILGNEDWPFPVPLINEGGRWRFDTAGGREEILDRRIGRNELAVIEICRTYVAAQRRYARQGHDGKPAGLYARAFQSDRGKRNGLYWPAAHGEPRSPLGDLVAKAAEERTALGADGAQPTPFHGYYFKILTEQGTAATGGAKSYVVKGELSGGFALVSWPATYDASGVMTFIVNQEGVVYQKDLGPDGDKVAIAMTFNPDSTWQKVPPLSN
jgi:hypothetical protein